MTFFNLTIEGENLTVNLSGFPDAIWPLDAAYAENASVTLVNYIGNVTGWVNGSYYWSLGLEEVTEAERRDGIRAHHRSSDGKWQYRLHSEPWIVVRPCCSAS